MDHFHKLATSAVNLAMSLNESVLGFDSKEYPMDFKSINS